MFQNVQAFRNFLLITHPSYTISKNDEVHVLEHKKGYNFYLKHFSEKSQTKKLWHFLKRNIQGEQNIFNASAPT